MAVLKISLRHDGLPEAVLTGYRVVKENYDPDEIRLSLKDIQQLRKDLESAEYQLREKARQQITELEKISNG